jgi:hypothetical protein
MRSVEFSKGSEEREAENYPALIFIILAKVNSSNKTGTVEPFDGGPVPNYPF